MFIVRPIQMDDLETLLRLASYTTTGLTTLPHDRDMLERRVEASCLHFSHLPNKPKGEDYLFVMEDCETHQRVGTCAVVSKVGGFEPFYTYEIKTTIKESLLLGIRKEVRYLQLKSEHNGPSEIGTLFLHPDYRKGGLGRFLSLSRFLFMAQFPQLFEKRVLAEMRGVFNQQGRSPFWEAVGKHFFEMDFEKADLMGMKDKSFIADLMPEHPLYLSLLPKEVQDILGEVHEATRPARRLLESEGFCFSNEIDIFEAGPVLSAHCQNIRSIKESHVGTIGAVTASFLETRPYLMARIHSPKEFCVAMGSLEMTGEDTVSIEEGTARALSVQKGDRLRYVLLKGCG